MLGVSGKSWARIERRMNGTFTLTTSLLAYGIVARISEEGRFCGSTGSHCEESRARGATRSLGWQFDHLVR